MTTDTDVGDGQWMTYAEIATHLGKSEAAAKQHVRRRKWRRQAANHPHDFARFWVPLGGTSGSHAAVRSTVVATSVPVAEELLSRAWDKLYADLRERDETIRELRSRLDAPWWKRLFG